MISIVSPAKSLDFETPINVKATQPRLLDYTNELIEILKTKAPEELKKLMGISDRLAGLNVERYHQYDASHDPGNSKASVFAFQGDVYQGLRAELFDEEDLAYAQGHLRILSGLYGLLRPLDLIQPYRLEMGTKLAFDDYKTLYDYWDNKILGLLKSDLEAQGDNVLINLASNEYFKSIDKKHSEIRVVDIEFKDLKNEQYKIVSFYAKKARGLMSRYIIQNRVKSIEEMKEFNYEGYYFHPNDSGENKLAFKRDRKP